MDLIIERGELLKALSHVTSVVERRTTIPILSNVLIAAQGGRLRFNATDLEREISEETTADVSADGMITVPAHMLHDIVRKLPDGAQVSMSRDAEHEQLVLRSGQARFVLQTRPVEDFPDLAAGEMSHSFVVPAHELRRLIDRTRFAISIEETRYYLAGIYLHVTANSAGVPMMRAVSTDGHRLALAELAMPKGADEMPGVIIPRKTVLELHRLLDDGKAEVMIGISQTKVRFETGAISLTSKLIDGQFPDYERVIPKGNDKELQVVNAEFINAVDRVSTIASEPGRAVKLSIESGKMTLSVNNPEGGSATEELTADYQADPLEIGFNARYLLDIAQQLESEKALFLLADPNSSAVVQDSEDDGALYVLMPMRV